MSTPLTEQAVVWVGDLRSADMVVNDAEPMFGALGVDFIRTSMGQTEWFNRRFTPNTLEQQAGEVARALHSAQERAGLVVVVATGMGPLALAEALLQDSPPPAPDLLVLLEPELGIVTDKLLATAPDTNKPGIATDFRPSVAEQLKGRNVGISLHRATGHIPTIILRSPPGQGRSRVAAQPKLLAGFRDGRHRTARADYDTARVGLEDWSGDNLEALAALLVVDLAEKVRGLEALAELD